MKEIFVNLYTDMLTNPSSSFFRNWGRQLKFVNFCHRAANYIITEVTERILVENLLQLDIVTPVTAALMHITAKYFITSVPKCFVLAVATVNAKLRAILLTIICKISQCASSLILCTKGNSAHVGQLCTKFGMCRIAEF